MKETSSSSLSTAPFLAVTGWKIFPSGPIPKAFTYGVIYEHIIATARLMSTDGGDDDEFSAAFNTSKPMSKGRQFFLSGHVNDIQDIRKNDFYFLKAKVMPSYSQTSPYNVSVTLNMTTASVVDASCDCKASAMGRCNHVAALLFALEDFTVQFGFEGLACTSDVCKWNVGRKKKKNPKPAHELRYNKKSAPDRIIEHDPRPTTSMTQDAEDDFINTFIKTLPSTREDSVFEHVLEIKYDEYEVDEADLRQRVDAAAELFREGFDSAAPAFEVDNTREQSDSPAWQEARYCRVTASNAKDVVSTSTNRGHYNILNRTLWAGRMIQTRAMAYGKERESEAFTAYSVSCRDGESVVKSGFWVNPKFPEVGASPDGLIYDNEGRMKGILEIKCPYVLVDCHPNNIEGLKPNQKKNLCYDLVNNVPRLKRTHKYYYQCQTQMAVCNVSFCDFLIWSPKGITVERILQDSVFWEGLLPRLQKYYRCVLLPEYLEMRVLRRLMPVNLK